VKKSGIPREQSKFFKLWQEEKQAGRDPHKAFEERGWVS
jgi:hypothetical protein